MDQRLSYIPNVFPSATWDFTGKQLPGRTIFNRATSAYGMLKGNAANVSYGGGTWGVNAARFYSNPWTGGDQGVLLECASTNLMTYSTGGANWSYYGGMSWVSGQGLAFDSLTRNGVNTGTSGAQTEGGPLSVISTGFNVSAGAPLTVSVIVERNTVAATNGPINFLLLQIRQPNGDNRNVRFDMRNGEWSTYGGAPDSVTVEALMVPGSTFTAQPNVWRVSWTINSAVGGAYAVAIYPMTDAGNLTGNIANRSFAIIHMQAETLRYRTSPIITTTAQVTRAADQLQLFYDQYQGNGLSIVVDYVYRYGYDGALFSAMNETGTPWSQIARGGNAIDMNQTGSTGGSTTNSLNGVIPQGAGFVLAANLGSNPAIAINGNVAGPKAGSSNASFRWGGQANFFSPAGAMDPFGTVGAGSQVIRSVRLYQAEFTEAQLEAITR